MYVVVINGLCIQSNSPSVGQSYFPQPTNAFIQCNLTQGLIVIFHLSSMLNTLAYTTIAINNGIVIIRSSLKTSKHALFVFINSPNTSVELSVPQYEPTTTTSPYSPTTRFNTTNNISINPCCFTTHSIYQWLNVSFIFYYHFSLTTTLCLLLVECLLLLLLLLLLYGVTFATAWPVVFTLMFVCMRLGILRTLQTFGRVLED